MLGTQGEQMQVTGFIVDKNQGVERPTHTACCTQEGFTEKVTWTPSPEGQQRGDFREKQARQSQAQVQRSSKAGSVA